MGALLWKSAAQHGVCRVCSFRVQVSSARAGCVCRCCGGVAGAAVDAWRCGSALPHLQSMPSVQQKRAAAIAGALAASRRRHALFRAERVLPAAERRLTVTPPSAKKRQKRTFCLVFDRVSGQDTRTKSAQTLAVLSFSFFHSSAASGDVRFRQTKGSPP